MIEVSYRSIDHYGETRRFKTLAGARRYAQRRIGPHPELGSFYAISGDGVGRIAVCGASLRDLFPELT